MANEYSKAPYSIAAKARELIKSINPPAEKILGKEDVDTNEFKLGGRFGKSSE